MDVSFVVYLKSIALPGYFIFKDGRVLIYILKDQTLRLM